MLGTVGVDDVGVFQLTNQAGLHVVDVDATKLIPLGDFLGGQTFGFCLFSKLINACNDFVDSQNFTSYISIDGYADATLFGLAAYSSE